MASITLDQLRPFLDLVYFLGMLLIVLRMLGVLERTFGRQQAPAQPAQPPVLQQPAPPVAVERPPTQVPAQPVHPPVLIPATPVPVQIQAPSGPFANAPPWFVLGLHDLGFHEVGDNLGIEKFIAQAHAGHLSDPWCAIWVNAKLEESGLRGTRSASSQSFRNDPNFVALPGPALGCIVVYWRGSGPQSGQGHVGFYVDETATTICTLGGNEGDMVQITPLYKKSASFGLQDPGFYWPKSVALPKIGAIATPAGSLAHVVTDPTSGGVPAPVPQHALVDQTLIAAVKDFEGFSAKAYGDFKQYSIGYGTKAASPSEVITEAEAEKRLITELSLAASAVERFAPNAPESVKRALTDLTYNAGTAWEHDPLGQLIQSGNYEDAKAHVLQYNHAGGKVNAGLTKRREVEVSWFPSSTTATSVT